MNAALDTKRQKSLPAAENDSCGPFNRAGRAEGGGLNASSAFSKPGANVDEDRSSSASGDLQANGRVWRSRTQSSSQSLHSATPERACTATPDSLGTPLKMRCTYASAASPSEALAQVLTSKIPSGNDCGLGKKAASLPAHSQPPAKKSHWNKVNSYVVSKKKLSSPTPPPVAQKPKVRNVEAIRRSLVRVLVPHDEETHWTGISFPRLPFVVLPVSIFR